MNEMPEVYERIDRKANKEHKCSECGGIIKSGESYELHKGIWDGEWLTYKRCSDCAKLCRDIDSGIDLHDEKVAFGMLFEYANENGEDLIRFCEIKKKRGGKIPDWVEHKIAVIKEAK